MKDKQTGFKAFSENFQDWSDHYIKCLQINTSKVLAASTQKTIMAAKVKLIKDLINDLPIGTDVCIYCQTEDCDTCPYGKKHSCFAMQEGKRDFLEWVDKKYR